MMCKICQKNETDNASGICWECIGTKFEIVPKNRVLKKIDEWIVLRKVARKLRDSGNRVIVMDEIFDIQKKFKFLCGILWKHQILKIKNNELECKICGKILASKIKE